MSTVLRAAAIYAIVLVIFRLAGRRTMSELTTFDLVLLLLCGEAVQQALLGHDFTVTGAVLVVLTFVVLEGAATMVRARFPLFDRLLEGPPLVIVRRGVLLRRRMREESIDLDDILHAARQSHGLSRLSQVRHAVLEPNGQISIIPEDSTPDDELELGDEDPR